MRGVSDSGKGDTVEEVLTWCGLALMIIAPFLGFLIGDDQRIDGNYNWGLGVLTFGFPFVAGAVLVGFGSLVRWLEGAETRRRRYDD